MKEYDIIVIGSGAGLLIVERALSHGLSVALVDKGPLGGTCLNLGCIPSKMLLYPADRVIEIGEAKKLGVTAEIRNVDFTTVMERMRKTVKGGEDHIRKGIAFSDGMDFYEGEGHFVKDHILEIKGERIKGKKIFIVAGARPHIPHLSGIEEVEVLTNESVLHLRERPQTMAIIGGGYIAAEYAHFFSAMGVKVVILQRNERLVPDEEKEISQLLKKEMAKRMEIYTSTKVSSVKKSGPGYTIIGREQTTGKEVKFTVEKIMVACGRESNADLLKVENTGIETDESNYIKINEYFETSKKNIWAFGDAIGKKMFRHVANSEAPIVWQNAIHHAKDILDYRTAPHAVFSHPEIASVGLTEEEARKQYPIHALLVGKANYSDVARGEAMMEEESFAKAVVEKKTEKILGFHIIGPCASILIQEVIFAMANDLDIWSLTKGMHIHPALPEVIIATMGNLQEPK